MCSEASGGWSCLIPTIENQAHIDGRLVVTESGDSCAIRKFISSIQCIHICFTRVYTVSLPNALSNAVNDSDIKYNTIDQG